MKLSLPARPIGETSDQVEQLWDYIFRLVEQMNEQD